MKKSLNIIMSIVLTFAICVIPFGSVLGVGTLITPTDPTSETLNDATSKVIGAIRWAGYICAVAVLVYIGIKYIMASASEKAELKGALIKYVIGAVIIIFGTQIAAWLFSIGG